MPSQRTSWRTTLSRPCTALALALLFVVSALPICSSADDIPHENYDLVGSNIDALIALLDSSIDFSEYALTGMYDEAMGEVYENLTVVQGLITPAELLLEKIRTLASSYENLSLLLPPFGSLSGQMDSFADMEVSLLGNRLNILSAAEALNLTGDALIEALDSIGTFNSLIMRMNGTIDEMLVSANRIINLTVEDVRPFTDNQLIPLIERLRELLRSIELEIEAIIHGHEFPWSESEPFLLLWLGDDAYYLGETIVGGGYLFFSGSFQSGRIVDMMFDSWNLTQASTTSGGRFSFSYEIPLNVSWLGVHSVTATASTPNGTISSDPVSLTIALVPTRLELTTNGLEFTIDEQLETLVVLMDVDGRPVGHASCNLTIEGNRIPFTTGDNGSFEYFMATSELGYGMHSAQASYDGELPYAACTSNTTEFQVNIPTHIDLTLFLARIPMNRYIVGNGTLEANESQLLPGLEITLSIDGVQVVNVTTDAQGEFAFSILATGLSVGGHVLRAELLNRDQVWRYSFDVLGFTIVGTKIGDYPFFPFLGKWGDLLSPNLTIPYLFIGPNSYIFWLLLLTMAGLTIKAVQMRRKKIREKKRAQERLILDIDKPITVPLAPALSAEALALELQKVAEVPATANERIVMYYQRLLSFLVRRAKISLKASMTHWEVAKLLKSLGYPSRSVESVTVLFERALYSGASLTDDDTVTMSAAMTGLVTMKKTEATNAV